MAPTATFQESSPSLRLHAQVRVAEYGVLRTSPKGKQHNAGGGLATGPNPCGSRILPERGLQVASPLGCAGAGEKTSPGGTVGRKADSSVALEAGFGISSSSLEGGLDAPELLGQGSHWGGPRGAPGAWQFWPTSRGSCWPFGSLSFSSSVGKEREVTGSRPERVCVYASAPLAASSLPAQLQLGAQEPRTRETQGEGLLQGCKTQQDHHCLLRGCTEERQGGLGRGAPCRGPPAPASGLSRVLQQC